MQITENTIVARLKNLYARARCNSTMPFLSLRSACLRTNKQCLYLASRRFATDIPTSEPATTAHSARLAGLPQDQVGGYSPTFAQGYDKIFGRSKQTKPDVRSEEEEEGERIRLRADLRRISENVPYSKILCARIFTL